MEAKRETVVLCGANSYEQKFYFNQDFKSLPEDVKKELQIMCVLFTEDIGGVITLEFEDYYFITVYTPNSQNELARLPYRMNWEDNFLTYLKKLDAEKPVILCGDLNVAHKEIDLKNPKTNRNNAGFTNEEREKITKLLESRIYRFIPLFISR